MKSRDLFFAIILVTSPSLAHAANPAWWTDPATSIWVSNVSRTTENAAPITVGQLKRVAVQAKRYLDMKLAGSGGAGASVDLMCGPFGPHQENHAPANVGQLKNVAHVFYDRIAEAGYNWQTGAPGKNPVRYPWVTAAAATAAHPENDAPANVGQLKNAFAFRVTPPFGLPRADNSIQSTIPVPSASKAFILEYFNGAAASGNMGLQAVWRLGAGLSWTGVNGIRKPAARRVRRAI